ncbi:MAG: hypothetical protein ABH859_01080 [Pseudomonadota bacterium]
MRYIQTTFILILLLNIPLSCTPKPVEQSLFSNLKSLAQTMSEKEVGLDQLPKYLPVKVKDLKSAKKIEIGSEKYSEMMERKELVAEDFFGYISCRNDDLQSIYRLEIIPKDDLIIAFQQDIVPEFGTGWQTIHQSKTSSVAYALPNWSREKVTIFFSLNLPAQATESRVQKIVMQKRLPNE